MTKFEPAWAIVTASNHVVAVCDSVALAASEIARLSVARMTACHPEHELFMRIVETTRYYESS